MNNLPQFRSSSAQLLLVAALGCCAQRAPAGADATAFTPHQSDLTVAAAPHKFGDEGTRRVRALAGGFVDGDTNSGALMSLGASWFFLDGLAIDALAEGMIGDASGTSTGGAGAAVEVEWHFVRHERWSAFLYAGCGFLASTEAIPAGGTTFNSTPRAGVGMTFQPDQSADWRLVFVCGWYHISNARTSSDNPGMNAIEAMVGVSIGF